MQYLMPFVLAMVVTMAGLPVLVRFANKWLFLDQPGVRKVHTAPIPRVGGLAMACGIFVAAVAMIHLQPHDRWFLAAAGVMILFGALDDRFDLDYRIKLLGQALAVGIVIALGDVQIRTITLDERIALPNWISVPFTALFLVGVTNAINFADGLDGLAGGTTFLCLCAIALISVSGEPGTSTPLALAFAGAVLGFLRFNTFPASVFMGDAGSQLLGFATAVLSIRATQSLSSPVSSALPLLLLALPILDTASVMVHRITAGRSPFSADRNHIHHKLLALGLYHHEAVMVIYAIQAILFLMAYFLRYESDLVILGVLVVFCAATIGILQMAVHGRWQLRSAHVHNRETRFKRRVNAVFATQTLFRMSYFAIAAALGAYAVLIIVNAPIPIRNIRIVVGALLIAAVVSVGVMRTAPLSLIERAMLYATATVVVYLDELDAHSDWLASAASWSAISVAAVASAVRLRVLNDRRFELTPLDILIVFVALVVPSLPGTLGLPHGGALAIAKLLVVFYAIEMLTSRPEDKAVWVRTALVAVLAALTMHVTL